MAFSYSTDVLNPVDVASVATEQHLNHLPFQGSIILQGFLY